jgi:translation initiation factor IF-2
MPRSSRCSTSPRSARWPVVCVTEGKVERGAGVRLIRDNVVIHEGKLKTLKRFKDEVAGGSMAGQECGMAFENYEDIRAGDVIECFRVEHVTRTL